MERSLWTDERIDDLVARIDQRFDEVDRRFDEVDRRFDRVERRIDGLERRIERVEDELIAIRRDMHSNLIVIMSGQIAGFLALAGLIVAHG